LCRARIAVHARGIDVEDLAQKHSLRRTNILDTNGRFHRSGRHRLLEAFVVHGEPFGRNCSSWPVAHRRNCMLAANAPDNQTASANASFANLCLSGCLRLYPVPDSRLCRGCKRATNRAFCDIPERSGRMLDEHGVRVASRFGFKSCNSGLGSKSLGGRRVSIHRGAPSIP
jgi:hypothetical protein